MNLNASQAVHVTLPLVRPGTARAFRSSAFGGGGPTVTLANDRVVAIFAPDGGARLVVFAARRDLPFNAVNATGALRDDVLLQPPPSVTDRIAKYTHSYPAGTFNRAYRTDIIAASGTEAVVRFRYTAPDLAGGAHFEKTVRLAADAARLVVDERVTFDGNEPEQRALTLSALAIPPSARIETSPTFLAWDAGHAISVAWNAGMLDRATWTPYGSNGTLTLVAAGSSLRTTYALVPATSRAVAQTFAEGERAWLAAHPGGTDAP